MEYSCLVSTGSSYDSKNHFLSDMCAWLIFQWDSQTQALSIEYYVMYRIEWVLDGFITRPYAEATLTHFCLRNKCRETRKLTQSYAQLAQAYAHHCFEEVPLRCSNTVVGSLAYACLREPNLELTRNSLLTLPALPVLLYNGTSIW